jgi:hypothetical protein
VLTLEAPKRNMSKQCVKIPLLPNVKKISKSIMTAWNNNPTSQQKVSTCCSTMSYQLAVKGQKLISMILTLVLIFSPGGYKLPLQTSAVYFFIIPVVLASNCPPPPPSLIPPNNFAESLSILFGGEAHC